MERNINFKESWISYRSKRLEEKKTHELKQASDGVPVSSFRYSLEVLSHVLDKSFNAFEDCEYLTKRIYSKYSSLCGIFLDFDIESEIKKDIAKSALVLCLKNLEKRAKSVEILLSFFKLFLLIFLPIIFITTRNFSIQKNLSISA